MTDAVGHAVRAAYFCTAVADLAMLSADQGTMAGGVFDLKIVLPGGDLSMTKSWRLFFGIEGPSR
jgi:hypothetical protein